MTQKIFNRIVNGFRFLTPFFPRYAREGELRVRIPALNRGQPYSLSTEEWLIPWLSLALRLTSGAFVDVGANIGQTLIKYRSLDRERDYVGFEPNPEAASFLIRLAQLNQLNAKILPCGLSSAPSLLQFFQRWTFDSTASIVHGFRPESDHPDNKRYVPVLKGDDVLKEIEINAVGVIKIDVEGGELEVLDGLQETLKSSQPIIFCEILPTKKISDEIAAFRRKRKDKTEQLLQSCGYAIYRLSKDRTEMAPYRTFPDDADLNWCEYVFLPVEQDFEKSFRGSGLIKDEQ